MAKRLPDAGVQETLGTLAASVALTVYETTAPLGLVASTARSVGSDSTGAVVSTTITTKLAVPVLPAASVAVQVTMVLPSGNVAPEGVSQLTTGAGSTLSVAEAE
jgi:hypothetical protein